MSTSATQGVHNEHAGVQVHAGQTLSQHLYTTSGKKLINCQGLLCVAIDWILEHVGKIGNCCWLKPLHRACAS